MNVFERLKNYGVCVCVLTCKWNVTIYCYFSQEWTKLERPEGAPWPLGRIDHAACCLTYGEDQPVLLITGGIDQNYKTLGDAWLLDVHSGKWTEVRDVWYQL